MILVDWSDVILGLVIGAGTGVAFFAGLGFGIRLALRAERPVQILMLSGVVRIAVLLGIGWIVAWYAGPWAVVGFALSFLITRTIATMLARLEAPARDTP